MHASMYYVLSEFELSYFCVLSMKKVISVDWAPAKCFETKQPLMIITHRLYRSEDVFDTVVRNHFNCVIQFTFLKTM